MFRVDRRLTVTFDKNMNSSGKIMTNEHMVSTKQIGLIQTQVQDLPILCIGIKVSRFTQNKINLYSKASENHRKVMNSN